MFYYIKYPLIHFLLNDFIVITEFHQYIIIDGNNHMILSLELLMWYVILMDFHNIKQAE